jgi:hypothetical protein
MTPELMENYTVLSYFWSSIIPKYKTNFKTIIQHNTEAPEKGIKEQPRGLALNVCFLVTQTLK